MHGRDEFKLKWLLEIPLVMERRKDIRGNEMEVKALEGERERRMKEGVW